MLARKVKHSSFFYLLVTLFSFLLFSFLFIIKGFSLSIIFQTIFISLVSFLSFLLFVRCIHTVGSKIKPVVADDDMVSPVEAAFGLGAVLVMVAISGYSAIYFEAIL